MVPRRLAYIGRLLHKTSGVKTEIAGNVMSLLMLLPTRTYVKN